MEEKGEATGRSAGERSILMGERVSYGETEAFREKTGREEVPLQVFWNS